nr:hypothetical protein [Candidatus Woesearchaeota archaeon]
MTLLDKHLAKDPRFKTANLSKVLSPNGFILGDYFSLVRDKPYQHDRLKLERKKVENGPIYPTIKELHIFSPIGDAAFILTTQGIINDEFKNVSHIRLNKTYPGKILESLKLFIEENKINNHFLNSFNPGTYTDMESNLRDDYYKPIQNKQTTLSL